MKTLQDLISYLERYKINKKIIDAFKTIDRKFFVPEDKKELAYEDIVIPLKNGVTISQPTLLALMLELLDIKEGQKILEIGTGSGFSTALLSYLVGPKGRVISIEIDKDAYEYAKEKLEKLVEEKIIPKNFKLVLGDGSLGYPQEAPYDRIISHAAVSRVPNTWIWQLKDRGIIVVPLGPVWGQTLTRIIKKNGSIHKESIMDVLFVPLKGKFGEI